MPSSIRGMAARPTQPCDTRCGAPTYIAAATRGRPGSPWRAVLPFRLPPASTSRPSGTWLRTALTRRACTPASSRRVCSPARTEGTAGVGSRLWTGIRPASHGSLPEAASPSIRSRCITQHPSECSSPCLREAATGRRTEGPAGAPSTTESGPISCRILSPRRDSAFTASGYTLGTSVASTSRATAAPIAPTTAATPGPRSRPGCRATSVTS